MDLWWIVGGVVVVAVVGAGVVSWLDRWSDDDRHAYLDM